MTDHYFKQQNEDLLIITEKNSDPDQILMGRVLGERVIINIKNANNPRSHFDYFSVLKTLHLKFSNGADVKSLCI